jgi:predicted PurR-regulated permease PerM
MKLGLVIVLIAIVALFTVSTIKMVDNIDDVHDDNEKIIAANKARDDQLMLSRQQGQTTQVAQVEAWQPPRSMLLELLSNIYTYLFTGLSILLASIISTLGRFYTNLWCEKWHDDKNENSN